MSEQEERKAVIAEAMTWRGTPFHHMGRIKGLRGGVDCGNYLAAVFEAVGLMPNFIPAPYSMQHALHSSDEWYLRSLERFTSEIQEHQAQPGDIVIYKVGRCYSHAGILIEPWPGKVIHAINSHGVIITHGTQDGLVQRLRCRRFFSRWAKREAGKAE